MSTCDIIDTGTIWIIINRMARKYFVMIYPLISLKLKKVCIKFISHLWYTSRHDKEMLSALLAFCEQIYRTVTSVITEEIRVGHPPCRHAPDYMESVFNKTSNNTCSYLPPIKMWFAKWQPSCLNFKVLKFTLSLSLYIYIYICIYTLIDGFPYISHPWFHISINGSQLIGILCGFNHKFHCGLVNLF